MSTSHGGYSQIGGCPVYYDGLVQISQRPFYFWCACVIVTEAALGQQSETDRLIAALRALAQPPAQVPWYADIEVWKLVSSFIGPVVVATVAWWGARFLKELEARQTSNHKLLEKQLEERQFTNQKLIEKRLEVFNEATPLMNDLYCYITRVGGWKDLSPPDVVRTKRRLDRLLYVNGMLFPDEFRKAYFSFIHACFRTYAGPARDALLRTTVAERTLLSNWDSKWEASFTNEEEDPRVFQTSYNDLMKHFASALGANQ